MAEISKYYIDKIPSGLQRYMETPPLEIEAIASMLYDRFTLKETIVVELKRISKLLKDADTGKGLYQKELYEYGNIVSALIKQVVNMNESDVQEYEEQLKMLIIQLEASIGEIAYFIVDHDKLKVFDLNEILNKILQINIHNYVVGGMRASMQRKPIDAQQEKYKELETLYWQAFRKKITLKEFIEFCKAYELLNSWELKSIDRTIRENKSANIYDISPIIAQAATRMRNELLMVDNIENIDENGNFYNTPSTEMTKYLIKIACAGDPNQKASQQSVSKCIALIAASAKVTQNSHLASKNRIYTSRRKSLFGNEKITKEERKIIEQAKQIINKESAIFETKLDELEEEYINTLTLEEIEKMYKTEDHEYCLMLLIHALKKQIATNPIPYDMVKTCSEYYDKLKKDLKQEQELHERYTPEKIESIIKELEEVRKVYNDRINYFATLDEDKIRSLGDKIKTFIDIDFGTDQDGFIENVVGINPSLFRFYQEHHRLGTEIKRTESILEEMNKTKQYNPQIEESLKQINEQIKKMLKAEEEYKESKSEKKEEIQPINEDENIVLYLTDGDGVPFCQKWIQDEARFDNYNDTEKKSAQKLIRKLRKIGIEKETRTLEYKGPHIVDKRILIDTKCAAVFASLGELKLENGKRRKIYVVITIGRINTNLYEQAKRNYDEYYLKLKQEYEGLKPEELNSFFAQHCQIEEGVISAINNSRKNKRGEM